MANFIDKTITTAGRELLASILVSGGEESIEFVTLAVGDGMPPSAPAALSELVHHLFDVAITEVEPSTQEGVAMIRGSFSNSETQGNFMWRELGVFARRAGTDEEPILFAYANAGEQGDYIGTVDDGSMTQLAIVMSVVIGSAPVLPIENGNAQATFADIADAKKQVINLLDEHSKGAVKHITAEERTKWDNAKTDIDNHAKDAVKHITAEERTKWNGAVLPPGSIIPSMALSMEGYLLCNGNAVSRTAYAALFAVIGTKFGAGNGSTTFNLPDFRDRTLWGACSNHESHYLHKVIPAGLPNITGSADFTDVRTSRSCSGAFYMTGNSSPQEGGGRSSNRPHLEFDASRSNPIYGKANTVQPPAIAVNIFIKY